MSRAFSPQKTNLEKKMCRILHHTFLVKVDQQTSYIAIRITYIRVAHVLAAVKRTYKFDAAKFTSSLYHVKFNAQLLLNCKKRNMELFCRTYLTLLLLNFLNINYLLFFICKHDHYVTHYVTQHPLMLSQARNISYLSDPYSNSYSSNGPTFFTVFRLFEIKQY